MFTIYDLPIGTTLLVTRQVQVFEEKTIFFSGLTKYFI